MTVKELIEKLSHLPSNAEVHIYISRRYGGFIAPAGEAREFIPGEGKVFIHDEKPKGEPSNDRS